MSLFLSLIRQDTVFSQEMDLVWMQNDDGITTIYHAKKTKSDWSGQQAISTGDNLKVTPAIASNDELKLAVWVEGDGTGKLYLRYTLQKNESWSSPQGIALPFRETTAPVLVFYNNVFYLFFAANYGIDDDIYMCRFDGNRWTDTVRIHQENDVPDILPEPRIIDAILLVSWQQFDGTQYVTLQQSVANANELTTSENTPITMAEKAGTDSSAISELPPGFKGIGRIHGYMADDPERPARILYGRKK